MTTLPVVRAPLRALGPMVAAAGLAACLSQTGGAARTSGSQAAPPPPAAKKDTAPPIIQVRRFTSASTVSVLGWSPDEPGYGLRAEVRRDGTLAAQSRLGEHVLYMSVPLVQGMGGFASAVIPPVPPGPVLLHAPAARDYNACNSGEPCSPLETIRLQMPDAVLRADRDSVVVRFNGSQGRNDWTIALSRDLVARYLRAVDSVSAAMRKR